MPKKATLSLLSILVLTALLALFLVPRFSPDSAVAEPTPEDGLPTPGLLDALPFPLAGEENKVTDPDASGGAVELEVVGRWPYGPALAVAAATINGTPYAFLGSGGVVLVLDMTDPSAPPRWVSS